MPDLVALSHALTPPDGFVPPERFARLFPYQQAALAQAPLRRHILFAHAPGLGKTPLALAVLHSTHGDHLIICPPSIALQWSTRMHEWTGLLPEVLITGKAVQDVTRYTRGPVIVSDSLAHLIPVTVQPSLLIIDEVHRFKSIDTRRSVFLFGGTYHSKKVDGIAHRAHRIVTLTGTPVHNTPVDLYPLLHVCAPHIAPSFKAYTERYCPPVEMRIPGAPFPVKRYDLKSQNLEELGTKLRGSLLIRPPTEACQAQLPALIEDTFYVHIDDPARGMDEAKVLAVFDSGPVTLEDEVDVIAVATLRKDTGLAKAHSNALRAWLADLLDGGERPLIWCWHQEVAAAIGLAIDVPYIHGGVSMEQRQRHFDDYRLGKAKALALTMASAGTGIDGLQHSGSLCIFVEEHYNPSDNEQAIARLHRAGQTRGVRVIRVRSATLIDRSIQTILRRKTAMIGQILT